MVILSHKCTGEWEDWDVQSQSNPTITYLVSMDHEEGTVKCDCPDFTYRKENLEFGGVKINDTDNHCKHIQEVMDEI